MTRSGQDNFNPLAGKINQGTFNQSLVFTAPEAQDAPLPKVRQEEKKPFQLPGGASPLTPDEDAMMEGGNGSVTDYESARTKGPVYDKQVYNAWQAHQTQVGVGPGARTEYPPGYTPYEQKLKNLSDPHPHMKSEGDPSYANPQKNLAEAQASQQPSTPAESLPQAQTPHATGGGAGGGGGGGFAGMSAGGAFKQYSGDVDEQLAGMQQELNAREQAGHTQANSLQGEADLMRNQAGQREQEVAQRGQDARQHLDHIGQLVQDYATREIDPFKFWHDANVPQKIGVIIGALAAGAAGGPEGAERFVNGQIDRSIGLQKDALDREKTGLYYADNLFQNYLKISRDEQEAYDKTRATMLGAAMVDAQKAAVEGNIPIESAEIRQFMASLKQQRDMLLMKIMSAKGGAGGGQAPPGGWLMADPQTLVKGLDGQDYLIANKAQSDDVTNMLAAFSRIKEGLAQGQQILSKRDWTDYANPFSANIKQGEAIDGSMAEAVAKLASARGVPSSVLQTVKEQVPQFGSRTAAIDAPKIDQMNKLLDKWAAEVVSQNRGVPVDVQMGPGVGKTGQNELKYWVRPGQATPQGQAVENKRQYSSFKPRQ